MVDWFQVWLHLAHLDFWEGSAHALTIGLSNSGFALFWLTLDWTKSSSLHPILFQSLLKHIMKCSLRFPLAEIQWPNWSYAGRFFCLFFFLGQRLEALLWQTPLTEERCVGQMRTVCGICTRCGISSDTSLGVNSSGKVENLELYLWWCWKEEPLEERNFSLRTGVNTVFRDEGERGGNRCSLPFPG